jgi:hypothetical protein
MTAARFLPWVRVGIGSALGAPDPGGGTPLPARAELQVAATVSGGAGGNATATVRVLGPVDVTGIDRRQVIRVEPAPYSTNVEPNYMAAVEFDEPGLPWLFTPAAAGADRLRPWLCLVVVERDSEATLETPDDRLPVLKLKNAASALPPLAESWAWAHAQIAGAGAPGDILSSSDGTRTLSRLLCPRRLTAHTTYIAAVVPTFEEARKAALGRLDTPVESAALLQPAWTATTAALDLPAYHDWEFSTGAEGDFEALVSALQRVSLQPEQVGRRPIAVEDQPAGLPDLAGVEFEGALGLPEDDTGPPSEGTFHAALRTLLNSPQPAPSASAPSGLALPPPIYGRWQAARPSIPASGGPPWLRELNLHAASRGAAGLGTGIVIDEQEQLMAAAWAQVEEILRANQLLRQAQLARAAARTLHADLSALSAAQLITLSAPMASRIVHQGRTVAAIVAASRVPTAMVGAAFRRALRSRGALARRAGTQPVRLLTKVNAGALRVVARRGVPPGSVLFDSVSDREPICRFTPARIAEIPFSGGDQVYVRLQRAAIAQQATMPPCEPRVPPERPALDLNGLCATIRAAVDPDVTVPARIGERVTAPPDWTPDDELEPVMVAPRFPTPMYRALAARSQDMLLPGVGDVPPNSVAALSTNPRFVEAFMVGLNHEMSRELLWRRFPTDQRGTYFQQFWDPAGRIPAPTTDAERHDHPPIHVWDPTLELGEHMNGGRQFVLLIRGDLLRRYPRTVIYLAQAEWYDDGGTPRRRPVQPAAGGSPGGAGFPERYPQFTGTLEPDITFIGFLVLPDDAIGSPDPDDDEPGWFVVLQQQATELRFGLDATAPAVPTGTWRDLYWGHVALTASGHIDLSTALTGINVTKPEGLEWPKTSAHLAAITTQQPFRAAIHASDLLPPT